MRSIACLAAIVPIAAAVPVAPSAAAEGLCHHPAWGKWYMQPAGRLAEGRPGEPVPFQHLLTSGHEVQSEFPYAAGRSFMRTPEGRIVCYDPRRAG